MENSQERNRAVRGRRPHPENGHAPVRAARASLGRVGRLALVAPLLLAGCGAAQGGARPGDEPGGSRGAASFTISYRQFSGSPSLGNGEGSADPRSEDYGALSIFVDRVAAATEGLGEGRAVTFSLATGTGAPGLAGVANHTYSAAYVAGGSLNGVWGFVYNSVPFGPTFREMVSFLYDGDGVRLANRIFAERGVDVVAFPVVGSPAQGSGYFLKPVGTPECPVRGDADCVGYGDGIGLEGMCGEPWVLRYLPPAETIVDLACDDFRGAQRLSFVQAIPGGQEFLTAIQQGAITGLEFATPLDDYDAAEGGFFANASAPRGSDGRNAGEIGLRFAHRPAWHQPFYLGWMIINKSRVWDRLTPDQQAAIERAARESVLQSFEASSAVQCDRLQRILDINDGRTQRRADGSAVPGLSADMIPTRWRAADLTRLRDATRRFLESGRGGASPSADQADYATVLRALHEHLGHPSVSAMLDAWTEPDFPVPGGCSR